MIAAARGNTRLQNPAYRPARNNSFRLIELPRMALALVPIVQTIRPVFVGLAEFWFDGIA
jgi:hypothetical protein